MLTLPSQGPKSLGFFHMKFEVSISKTDQIIQVTYAFPGLPRPGEDSRFVYVGSGQEAMDRATQMIATRVRGMKQAEPIGLQPRSLLPSEKYQAESNAGLKSNKKEGVDGAHWMFGGKDCEYNW